MLMSPVPAAAASIGVGPRRLAGRCWMSPGWSKKTIAPPAASASTASPIQASRRGRRDRKSTRLNSSHLVISYAVFCLKKKKKNKQILYYLLSAHIQTTHPTATIAANLHAATSKRFDTDRTSR